MVGGWRIPTPSPHTARLAAHSPKHQRRPTRAPGFATGPLVVPPGRVRLSAKKWKPTGSGPWASKSLCCDWLRFASSLFPMPLLAFLFNPSSKNKHILLPGLVAGQQEVFVGSKTIIANGGWLSYYRTLGRPRHPS